MIQTIDLTKEFEVKRKKIKALDNVNISIEKGQLGALVGHNGAGKTTLLKILSTLVIPTYGDAIVNGYSVLKDEKKVRENIGLVTVSERAFYYRLTAMDNLIFFSSLQGLSLSDAKRRAKELLEFVGLQDWANIPYMKFSTGMQKRLALARALITDPPVILMDEPTLGLDLLSAREFRRVIKSLKDKTILMSSHYLREVEELANEIFLIKRGKIVEKGTLEELKEKVGNILEVEVNYLTDDLKKYLIEVHDDYYILRIPEKEIEKLRYYKEIEKTSPNLDDIYVYFIGEERETPGKGKVRPWRVRE
ncbi:ABC transporter ATP-binding protein [Acidianus manzaensis]|uniref:Multidrug ABC transporter ATP-binding protein n=1 Tax=Acidianus manzaensis TaxID=282676 RepID=A0A1W6K3M0_9CREN|nr:ABC transporter ATP-binding protein [Acidianus manzaensis]ARM77042.1 multidrug ABC transporter ATP-binding protein [Acidianus manzaensis]